MKIHRVFNGADRLALAKDYLKGRRIGMLTCASGVTKDAIPTFEIINREYGLSALFAPEHGIRTNLQAGSWGDTKKDVETGAALFNLTSKGSDDIEYALSLCDIVVYDIQDVGARFYTYLYNLTYIMRECAKRNIPVLIFDRINPIGGKVQGSPLCEERFSSFIGEYNIPTRYGLTVGELAGYLNCTKGINCSLTVIPVDGWCRDIYADETDLLWVNPSPNIASVNSAINYIGTCIFEATNVSEGRGTTRPFDLVGAPFINSDSLCRDLNSFGLDGVVFRRAFFTPWYSKWQGTVCEGVELHVTNRETYDPFLAGLLLYAKISEYSEFSSRPQSLSLRVGTDVLGDGIDVSTILKYHMECMKYCENFKKETKDFLLYT